MTESPLAMSGLEPRPLSPLPFQGSGPHTLFSPIFQGHSGASWFPRLGQGTEGRTQRPHVLVLSTAGLVSCFRRGQELLGRVGEATLWALLGNGTVSRPRLGTAIPGLQDEVWGWKSLGRGIRKLPQIAWVAAPTLGVAQLGSSWPVGTWAWTLGAGEGAGREQGCSGFPLPLLEGASLELGVRRRGDGEPHQRPLLPGALNESFNPHLSAPNGA